MSDDTSATPIAEPEYTEDALTDLLEYSRLKSTHSSDQRRRGANTTGEREARRRPDDLGEKNTMQGSGWSAWCRAPGRTRIDNGT